MSTRYTKDSLEEAVKNSESFAGVLRFLNIKQAGGSQSWLKKRVLDFGIDFSHFTGQAHNKGRFTGNRKTAADILVVLPEGSHRPKHEQLKRALLEIGVTYRCGVEGCPNPEPFWNGKPITLDVDHIDRNWLDNRPHNLRFACPNCHSQL